VNSARATKGSDIEETALRTNLEAAEEIARQLRLRDLGGLVVIDFIDMESGKNQRDVENRLRDSLKYDRARVQTGKISRFGLLELSRQRLQTSLGESSHIACPRCSGTGHIRSIESTALHILRILQEEAMKENTGAIHAQVPVDVATYLLNEKRNEFHMMEQRLKVNVLLIPNSHLETPNYVVTRLRHDELNQNDVVMPSYKLMEVPAEQTEVLPAQKAEPVRPQAAVQGITPSQPAPIARPVETRAPSILEKIFGWLTRKEAPKEPARTRPRGEAVSRDDRRRPRRDGRDGNRHEGRGQPDHRRDQPRQRPQESEARRGEQDSRRQERESRRQDSDTRRHEQEARRQEQEARRHERNQRREESEGHRQERSPRREESEAQRPEHQQAARPPRAEQAAIEQRAPGERPEHEAEGRGRRRRRRGGRGERGERRDGMPPQTVTPREEELAAEDTGAVHSAVEEQFEPQPYREPVSAPVVEEEPALTTADFEAPVRQPQPAPVAEESPAPPPPSPAQGWKMEPIELPSDMVMVETRESAATPSAIEVPEDQPAPRKPRPRPVEPETSDEPLVQVETRNEAETASSNRA